MEELLLRCDRNLSSLPCCHNDGRDCNCCDCLRAGFFDAAMPDRYECPKKMNSYVLNYGASYASEFYHYLEISHILDEFQVNAQVRILSLGCGFAPDLIAISRYTRAHQLPLNIEYHGIDNSVHWESARYSNEYSTFSIQDVLSELSFNNYDIVVMAKVFSTIYRSNNSRSFLRNFTRAVSTQLNDGAFVIFNDINSRNMGRDYFHSSVKRYFRNMRQFFFGDRQDWTDRDWIQIPHDEIVFSIPRGLSITPLNTLINTVVFEYRK